MNLLEYALLEKRYRIGNLDGRSNFHTHTFYCDGKDEPRLMVERALELGFGSIGFSGHQYSEPDANYAMSKEDEKKYIKDIRALAKEFKGRINVYLGIERDYACEAYEGFQYVIGSCHHVLKDGVWLCVDESPEVMEKGVRELFGGDYMEYVKLYYEMEAKVLEKTHGQIVGHFDLVTKFNSGNKYFDENSEEYKRLAIESCDRIIDSFMESENYKSLPAGFPPELGFLIENTGMPIFEINTGATVKGLRDIPYPAPFIIEHLADRGAPMIISSDCHDRRYLDFGFGPLKNRYDI